MKPDITQLTNISAVTNSVFKCSNSIPTKITEESSKTERKNWEPRKLNDSSKENSNKPSKKNIFSTSSSAVEDKVKLYPSSDSSETLTEVSKKDQMLEILRNFDSKNKKEQVLYSSKGVVVKAMNTPKKWIVKPKESVYPVNSSPTKETIYTGGASIAEKLKMFNNAKVQEETTRTKIQREPERKIISAVANQYQKLEPIIEEDIPKETKLTRSKSFSDRLKRFQKDQKPCIPVSSFGLGSIKPKNQWIGAKNDFPKSEVIEEEAKDVIPKINCFPENLYQKDSIPEDTVPQSISNSSNQQLDIPIIQVGSIFSKEDGWINQYIEERKSDVANGFELNSCGASENITSIKESSEAETNFQVVEPIPELSPPEEQGITIKAFDGINLIPITTEKTLISVQSGDESIPIQQKQFLATENTVQVTSEKSKLPKKSVSFKTAWDGSLATTKTFINIDEDNEISKGTLGRLLINVEKIEGLISPADEGIDRTLEISISQGNQSVTSAPIHVSYGLSEGHFDWECSLSIVSDLPISFALKIRDIPLANEEKLSRSKSTRNYITGKMKSLGSRIMSKLERSDINTQMKHSFSTQSFVPFDSRASFSSISSFGFRSNSNIAKTALPLNTTLGQYNICSVKDWVQNFEGIIEKDSLELFQSDWGNQKKSTFKKQNILIPLGKLKVQLLFLPIHKEFGNTILPLSISEFQKDQLILALHQKVWKEGFLEQCGGDCKEWKRRYFKLAADTLVAHHPTTLEQRSIISLNELESIRYFSPETLDDLYPNYKLDDFVLEFKDGRTISFRVLEDSKTKFDQTEKGWIESVEESHYVLKENKIPEWLRI